MIALLSLFIILIFSILITRMVTVALMHTGISREIAQFQAASAFSGSGFTTSESEKVINHPVRRRIILMTMRMGSVGIVTMISSLVLTFVEAGGSRDWAIRLTLILLGLIVLWLLTTSRWVNHYLSRLITWALRRWTDLDVIDYANLLNVASEYRIVELTIEADDWLANRLLRDLRLSSEGVLVLGIHRVNGDYVGTPLGDTHIYPDDRLILYGRASQIAELSQRRPGMTGYLAHQEAVAEQIDLLEEQADREQSLETEHTDSAEKLDKYRTLQRASSN